MNDRAVSLLEQYEVELLGTHKGRDSIVCNTDKGCLIFKEYNGSEERLKIQNRLLQQMVEKAEISVESILPTKEEALFVKDNDGQKYILKTFREGRECNIKEPSECLTAVKILAKLHEHMELVLQEGEQIIPFSQSKEYEKRNRELKKVRKYLKQRSQKTWFEINLLGCYDYFLEQAYEVTESWDSYEKLFSKNEIPIQKIAFCHGDYQYHNILYDKGEWFVANFEKCLPDNPIRDLYLLLRKLLEKSNWSLDLGTSLMAAYESLQPISAESKIDLYYRLAYPEKFWKIVNFYYNSGKSWIPGRNQEKLDKLIAQEREKKAFLEEAFRI